MNSEKGSSTKEPSGASTRAKKMDLPDRAVKMDGAVQMAEKSIGALSSVNDKAGSKTKAEAADARYRMLQDVCAPPATPSGMIRGDLDLGISSKFFKPSIPPQQNP